MSVIGYVAAIVYIALHWDICDVVSASLKQLQGFRAEK